MRDHSMENIKVMRHRAYSNAMLAMDDEKSRLLYASYVPQPFLGQPSMDSDVQVLRFKRSELDPFLFEVLKGKEVFGESPVHMRDLLALNGGDNPRLMFHVSMGCGEELRQMQQLVFDNPNADVEALYLEMKNAETEPDLRIVEDVAPPPLNEQPEQDLDVPRPRPR